MVDHIENRPPSALVPSDPFDPNDRPRFGQLQETAKDVFVKELTDFFNYNLSDGLAKIGEMPNIQKFSFEDTSSSGLETVVNIINAYGDTPDIYYLFILERAEDEYW